MKDGKTCSTDKVVTEMVRELPEEAFDSLARLFRERALNVRSRKDQEVWSEYEVNLIMKDTHAD